MNDTIVEALAKARWNESVHVKIEGDHQGDNEESSSTLLLEPRLDRENGGIRWESVDPGPESGESKSSIMEGHIRTKTWMFPMLNDERRNTLYETAIERASQVVVKRFGGKQKEEANSSDETPHQRVLRTLDIGSGTGLLALLSAKHLSKAYEKETDGSNPTTTDIKVTSLEMAGPMADLARSTVALEMKRQKAEEKTTTTTTTQTVDIIEGHSCQYPAMTAKKVGDAITKNPVVLCTSELLESGLLGEGWLPAMRDAWKRHLHPDAVVVPQGARVYAQLVSGVSMFAGPFNTLEMEENVSEEISNTPYLRFCTTSKDSPRAEFLSDGSYSSSTGERQGIQIEIHAERFMKATGSNSRSILQTLSDPIEALEFDVTSADTIPSPDPLTRTPNQIPFVATETGNAEGILFWWELDLFKGQGKDLTYTTKPGSDFQDHWHQCLYIFPPINEREQKDRYTVAQGQDYILLASHTDSKIHFDLRDARLNHSERKRLKPTIPSESNPIFGPRRCWQLNDKKRLKIFRNGIRNALNSLQGAVTVLDISDFSLCAMISSLLGAKNVTSIESASSGIPLGSAKVAQVGNDLPLNGAKFQIVNCHAESFSRDLLIGDEESIRDPNRMVNLVVGEPYYEMLEGWSIETALNYFYTIRMLKKKSIVHADALSVPSKAIILACGIQCEDIGKSYRKRHFVANRCQKNPTSDFYVRGFNHQPVADCWKYDQHGMSMPLGEYNVVPVTEVVVIGTLDFEGNTIIDGNWTKDDSNGDMEVIHSPFTNTGGECHAIAFWVDYDVRCGKKCSVNTTRKEFATISTGFTNASQFVERQTVRVLSDPQPVCYGKSLKIPRYELKL